MGYGLLLAPGEVRGVWQDGRAAPWPCRAPQALPVPAGARGRVSAKKSLQGPAGQSSGARGQPREVTPALLPRRTRS